MPAWEKRVHVTNVVAAGYALACQNYDFERNATKVGMLLTIDYAPYVGVDIQGHGPLSFDDADGGADGEATDNETEEEDDDDDAKGAVEACDVKAAEAADEAAGDEYESDSYADEEDDTDVADAVALAALGEANAPPGFVIEADDLPHENDVIGKWILFKFAGAPLDPADFGWYLGKVTMALTSREKKKNSECNFYIAFATKDDHKNDAVVRAFKEKTKVTIAAGVDAESRGASARWVLLAKSPCTVP